MDPEAASKIAASDEQKLIRAIEVCLLTKRPISEVHRDGRAPLEGWRAIKIGLMPPRDVLYERMPREPNRCWRGGWIEEVRSLIAAGLSDGAKSFEFIGYREAAAVVRGKMKFEDAQEAIQSYAPLRQAAVDLVSQRTRIRWFNGSATAIVKPKPFNHQAHLMVG